MFIVFLFLSTLFIQVLCINIDLYISIVNVIFVDIPVQNLLFSRLKITSVVDKIDDAIYRTADDYPYKHVGIVRNNNSIRWGSVMSY